MNTFNKIYNNIINELISSGPQARFHFPKLTALDFKVIFTEHAALRDVDRDITKNNDNWLFSLIDDNISNEISSKNYTKENIVKFQLLTKYDDFVQIVIKVDFNNKIVVLLTMISTLTQQRFDRLLEGSFIDNDGIKNIPIKC